MDNRKIIGNSFTIKGTPLDEVTKALHGIMQKHNLVGWNYSTYNPETFDEVILATIKDTDGKFTKDQALNGTNPDITEAIAKDLETALQGSKKAVVQ